MRHRAKPVTVVRIPQGRSDDGRPRHAFYSSCTCGWEGRSRATRAAADQEWRDHKASVEAA